MSEVEGTPLDAIEQGDVKYEADAQRMNEIMKDINYVAEPSTTEQPRQQAQQPMMQQSMMQQPMMQQTMQYTPDLPAMRQPMYRPVYNYEEEEEIPVQRKQHVRKNTWSSMFDTIRDPIVVALLIFIISLPVLHTQLGKYASWMYKVGGQLSWVGLLIVSLFGGIMFASYQSIMNIL